MVAPVSSSQTVAPVSSSQTVAPVSSSQMVAPVSSSQMVGELTTVEFVKVGDGLVAFQLLTAPRRLAVSHSASASHRS